VADFNIQRAQMGIVFLDEIDKIAREAKGRSMFKDVNGEGVQQGFILISIFL
jgi:ATP-dependent Clp protease ATP-binding subunit ClpX